MVTQKILQPNYCFVHLESKSNIYLMKKNLSPESGPEIWAESVSKYVNKEHQNYSYKSKKRVERRELQPMKVLLPCTKYAWFKVSVIGI